MNILITNDDGIDAVGLHKLVEVMAGIGDVYVVAPNGQCSSNSHHLTIKGRIRYEERTVPFAKKAYALWGTPADCAHMGIYSLIDEKIDLVVSGINRGANVSTDIIYSGTIAAAREAFIHHVPAIALSLDSFASDDYLCAAKWGAKIALRFFQAEQNRDLFINVNVPSLPEEEIRGIKICDRVGEIVYHDAYSLVEEEGRNYISIDETTTSYVGDQSDERIDVVALRRGYVTVMPLYDNHVDLSSVDSLKKLFE